MINYSWITLYTSEEIDILLNNTQNNIINTLTWYINNNTNTWIIVNTWSNLDNYSGTLIPLLVEDNWITYLNRDLFFNYFIYFWLTFFIIFSIITFIFKSYKIWKNFWN